MKSEVSFRILFLNLDRSDLINLNWLMKKLANEELNYFGSLIDENETFCHSHEKYLW